jgi:nucleoside 2-deoxyribosyltransferase
MTSAERSVRSPVCPRESCDAITQNRTDSATLSQNMRIYLAGPLFTTPEREFNDRLAAALRARGLDVFVPQEHPAPEPTGHAIFQKDLAGLDAADAIVAIMDGPDPDSGTCWECGYAYATNRPVVLFRSDLRTSGDADDIPYNAMLIGAADAHIELPLATVDRAADAIQAELMRLRPD